MNRHGPGVGEVRTPAGLFGAVEKGPALQHAIDPEGFDVRPKCGGGSGRNSSRIRPASAFAALRASTEPSAFQPSRPRRSWISVD